MNFELQRNSPCRRSGLFFYDLGARYYDDIPESPDSLQIVVDTTQLTVTLEWLNPIQTIRGNSLDTLKSIHIWRNNELLVILNDINRTNRMTYMDQLPQPDYYRYQICAEDTAGLLGRPLYTAETWMGGSIKGIVIWELDPTPITAASLATELSALGYSEGVYISRYFHRYDLSASVDAVFVCLGIYPNNHILTDEEAEKLRSYLLHGGNLYLEGGDTWYYDPQTVIHPYFQINPLGDGTNDLQSVLGNMGTPFENYSFSYSGENSFIDDIDQTAQSTKILYNPADNMGTAVMRLGDGFNTIGSSFEFGGLVDNPPYSTKKELVKDFLKFFGIFVTDLNERQISNLPRFFQLYQNYPNPFNPGTTIEFDLPTKTFVSLKIFNVLGEEITTLVDNELAAGNYRFSWDSQKIASGIYFYRLETLGYVVNRKMILLR